ncbi:hypothetical protein [Aureivirga sp. CE67]|uniref:hypothetical protein n=1 Tax=Aureivirga sp. CE67 TaxID=1788983 RepID=UPI001E3884C7|nr:hypothetical protein [Aureivirga sp. CE67]
MKIKYPQKFYSYRYNRNNKISCCRYVINNKGMGDRKKFAIKNTYTTHYSHVNLNNNEFSIVSIEEDNFPPEYFFFSEYLTDIINPEEIWGKGLFLLNLYNGAVNIDLFNNEWDSNVKFTRLDNWVTNENLTPFSTENILPINPFPENLQTENESKEMLKRTNFITYSSFLAKSESDVLSLLLLAGNDLDWVTLYAIYDTLKYYSQDFDKLISICGYSKNDIKAFTGTANNFGLLGINSRHGEMGWSQPKITKSLFDSKKMILEMAKIYIESK